MRTTVDGLTVRAIASTVPQNVLPIASLSEVFGGRNMERVIASSGIRELRIAPPGVTTGDLCLDAARRVLESTQTAADAIDGLVFVSQTPDWRIPATSAILQHRLGLRRDIVAFDINHGCIGHVYGLYQAAVLIGTGGCRRVLVLAGDIASLYVHPKDMSVRVLMGDAGSATLVEQGAGTVAFDLRVDGSRFDALLIPAGGARLPHSPDTAVAVEQEGGNWRSPDNVYMNGLKITEFALTDVVKLVRETLANHNLTPDAVGQFVFHQANQFVLNSVARSLKLSPDQAPLLVERFGNTSSASIPMTLCQKFGGTPCNGANEILRRTMLIGFGVGLFWGTALLDLSETSILPVEDLAA